MLVKQQQTQQSRIQTRVLPKLHIWWQELIPLDLEKTANLLIQATDLGDAQAQFNLGMAYGAGDINSESRMFCCVVRTMYACELGLQVGGSQLTLTGRWCLLL